MILNRRSMVAIMSIACILAGSLYAGDKKEPVLPDSIQIHEKDIDTTYRVVGVVGHMIPGDSSQQIVDDLFKEIRNMASKMEADAIIFGGIVEPDLRKAGITKAMMVQMGGINMAVGVAARFLDETEYAEWKEKHPRKEFDRKAEVEIFEKDVERLYSVKGVALGYSAFGKRDLPAVDAALKEFAAKKRCNGIIFTEYEDNGWSGWGVMVKYKKPRGK